MNNQNSFDEVHIWQSSNRQVQDFRLLVDSSDIASCLALDWTKTKVHAMRTGQVKHDCSECIAKHHARYLVHCLSANVASILGTWSH